MFTTTMRTIGALRFAMEKNLIIACDVRNAIAKMNVGISTSELIHYRNNDRNGYNTREDIKLSINYWNFS